MCEDTLLLSGEPIDTCISLSAVKGDETKGKRGNPKTVTKVRISPFSPHVSPPWTLFSFTPFSLFRTFNFDMVGSWCTYYHCRALIMALSALQG